MSSTELLPSGIPDTTEYQRALALPAFKSLKSFSDNFLQTNNTSLGEYSKKWVQDPLYQWSRQWEYHYVHNRLQPLLSTGGGTVLDAGAGFTFFPYYLTANFNDCNIYCCDYDPMLETLYKQANDKTGAAIKFDVADMKQLAYDDNFFDTAYCVSVLEHTDDYDKIIDEFYRVLKPGGRLIITFDLSIDGQRDISRERGEGLLKSLTRQFTSDTDTTTALSVAMDSPESFTTLHAEKIDPALLPWKPRSAIRKTAQKLIGKNWPPPLTFYCICLSKP